MTTTWNKKQDPIVQGLNNNTIVLMNLKPLRNINKINKMLRNATKFYTAYRAQQLALNTYHQYVGGKYEKKATDLLILSNKIVNSYRTQNEIWVREMRLQ